jgi:hypothetical protein
MVWPEYGLEVPVDGLKGIIDFQPARLCLEQESRDGDEDVRWRELGQ